MITHKTYPDIPEMLTELSQEKALMKAMFNYRDIPVKPDMIQGVAKNRDSVQKLIDHGVILEQGNILELEGTYMQFFLDVMGVNEEISIQSVEDCIRTIRSAINEYNLENDNYRKTLRLKKVRSTLLSAARRSVQNCIRLKRNVETTYKQEPVYSVKKQNLQILLEQKNSIEDLIRATEKEIDAQEAFFTATRSLLGNTLFDVTSQFTWILRTLDEIHRQISEYLNQIEYQNRLLKHIRKLQYLKDQKTLVAHTDVQVVLTQKNPMCWEPTPRARIKLSLNTLLNSDDVLAIVKRVANSYGNPVDTKSNVTVINRDDIEGKHSNINVVRPEEVYFAFRSTSHDLFEFVMNYNHGFEVCTEERVLMFCQIVTIHVKELKFGPMKYFEGYNYPLVTSK